MSYFEIVDPQPEPNGRLVAIAWTENDAAYARRTLLDEGEAADLVILAPRDTSDELADATPTALGALGEATAWAAHARRAHEFADACERRRDVAIVRALELGARGKDAAHATGLTSGRITQIRQTHGGDR